MTEVRYRIVQGFERYRVGDDGSLWWLNGEVWQAKKPRVHIDSGYRYTTLSDNGKSRFKMLHRIVLEAFVGPCPEGMQTRHLDGDKGNNRLTNLAWGTPVENAADRKRHVGPGSGRKRVAGGDGGHKLSDAQAVEIRKRHSEGVGSVVGMAREFGVTTFTIRKLIQGKTYRHLLPIGREGRARGIVPETGTTVLESDRCDVTVPKSCGGEEMGEGWGWVI